MVIITSGSIIDSSDVRHTPIVNGLPFFSLKNKGFMVEPKGLGEVLGVGQGRSDPGMS